MRGWLSMTVAALCGFLPAILSAQGLTKATLEIGPSRHAWTGSAVGPMIANRGQRALSAPIVPGGVLPQSAGVITAVRWRYSFTRVPPPDLQAYLCNADRCVMLPGAEGKTNAFVGDDASKGFVFAFRVPGNGGLAPSLQGRSNEVTVSFR